MSDLPSPIPTILAASNIALVVLGVAVVGFFIWTIRGDLDRDVRSRYPWRTIWMSQLPFTEAWRSRIAPGDLAAFVRNRRRHLAFMSVGLLLLWSATAYGYVHAVVDVYRCHVSMLDGSMLQQRCRPSDPPSAAPR